MGTGMGGSVRVWRTSPGVHDRGGDQPFERRVLSLLLKQGKVRVIPEYCWGGVLDIEGVGFLERSTSPVVGGVVIVAGVKTERA